MKCWEFLKPGDLIDLVAPGYPADRVAVQKGIRVLESWGLRVRQPHDLIRPFYFHAQTDEKRFQFIDQALRAKDSKAVWCVRGGYGAGRLWPSLLSKKAPAKAKLFIGISDNSILHTLLNEKWKWTSVHGPIVERLGSEDLPQEIIEETRRLVFGELDEIVFSNLKPLNLVAEKKKKINGPVLGGNLATLQSLIGTKLQPKFKNSILFLEDVGERGYRLDRMLEQFKQANLLKSVQAVTFGHFTGGLEPTGSEVKSYVEFAIERFAESINIPVFSGVEAGHGPRQRPVPLASEATILKGQLRIQAGHQ